MKSERDAVERTGTVDRAGRGTARERAEQIVPPLAVIAISIAGVLASFMQPRAEISHAAPDGTRVVVTGRQLPALRADEPHAAAESPDCRAAGSPRVMAQRRGQG